MTPDDKNSSRFKLFLRKLWNGWCYFVLAIVVLSLVLDYVGVSDFGFGPK